jgi:RHS repeat-associated protein
VVAEVVNGQPVSSYTYGLERISELQTASNTASFYQYDGRGTVRQLTNSAGAVTDTYEYDAFGNLIAQATVPAGASPTLNSYLYRGERYDADLGLYYLRARWYNPVTGRFLTRDPYQGSAYDPASLHRYNYARANPVNFVDPSGRSAAAENALVLSLNSVAEAAGVAALGYEVRCALYAEASAVHLVDEHMDQDITQLGLLMNQCAAQITVSQFARATAGNLLFMGAVGVAGRGIGWLLESGEQGALLGNGVLGSTDRMGTYTEAGAEVSHSPTVTRIGSDSVSTRVAQNITPIDGVHDVVVHGALYDESGAMFMVEGVPTNASQIADAVTSNPSWNGQPIRLVTCYGGCGPAQELSDILGVDVQGATGPVGVLQSVGSDPVVENGAWITFSPSGVE